MVAGGCRVRAALCRACLGPAGSITEKKGMRDHQGQRRRRCPWGADNTPETPQPAEKGKKSTRGRNSKKKMPCPNQRKTEAGKNDPSLTLFALREKK